MLYIDLPKELLYDIFMFMTFEVIFNRSMKSRFVFENIYNNQLFWKLYLENQSSSIDSSVTDYRDEYIYRWRNMSKILMKKDCYKYGCIKQVNRFLCGPYISEDQEYISSCGIYEIVELCFKHMDRDRYFRYACEDILKSGIYDLSVKILDMIPYDGTPCRNQKGILDCVIKGKNIDVIKYVLKKYNFMRIKKRHLEIAKEIGENRIYEFLISFHK